MAMSSITVSGITPALSILGDTQQFIFNQPASSFQLQNLFVPTSLITPQTSFEFRNNTLSGFRWVHSTNDTDTIGKLTIQSYVGASPTGFDFITFNNDNTITFNVPIAVPPVIGVQGSSETISYSALSAQPASFNILNNFIPVNPGESSLTELNFVNSNNYKYQFLQDTPYLNTEYGTFNFNLINNLGSVQNVFTVENTGGTDTTVTFANDVPLLVPAPVLDQQAANKGYVDAIAAGFSFRAPCYAATTANLTGTYSNGTSGVGATLTNSGALAALVIDDEAVSVNDRILVKDQTTQYENGIYVVTVVGDGSTAWVLTRSTDYDTDIEIHPGTIIPVEVGTVNYTTIWLETLVVTTVGTDPISFIKFAYGPSSFLQVVNNLSDVNDAPTSRNNLGLTNVAIQNVTNNSVLIGGAANSIVSLSVPVIANKLLLSGASSNPFWSNVLLTNNFNNLFLGINSTVSTGNYNTAFGLNALRINSSGINNSSFGYENLYTNTTGISNSAFGIQSLFYNNANNNSAFGVQSLFSNTVGINNCAFGNYSSYSNVSGTNICSFGYQALYSNTSGDHCSAFGYQALYSNTTGNYNIAFGQQALFANSTGSNNSAFGDRSLVTATTANNNSAFGYHSLYSNTIGNSNCAFGLDALYSNISANNNSAFGTGALENNSTGANNTAFGTYALNTNSTGSNNLVIGYNADVSVGNLNNAMAIGANALVTSNNTCNLGSDGVDLIVGNGTGTITAANIWGSERPTATYYWAQNTLGTSITLAGYYDVINSGVVASEFKNFIVYTSNGQIQYIGSKDVKALINMSVVSQHSSSSALQYYRISVLRSGLTYDLVTTNSFGGSNYTTLSLNTIFKLKNNDIIIVTYAATTSGGGAATGTLTARSLNFTVIGIDN